MKKYALLSLLSLFVLLLPVHSGAEIREGSFEVNPFGGYFFPSTSAEDHGVLGIRLGYNFTPNWGVEGAYDHFVATSEMFHADAIYHFDPTKQFNPFVVGGIGDAFIREDTHNAFMGNIGLGFKYSIAENLAFRTDVRGVFTDFSSLVATAGFTLTFGGKQPKAVPPPPPPPPAPKEEEAPPPPPPTPAPKVEEAPPPPSAPAPVKVVLEDIHFGFDKATLTKMAEEILDKNIQTIKENPGIEVQIEGHSCAHGPDAYNMALSERRANAVKEYLVKGGVPADRLSTISYGETRLAMPEIPTPRNKESVEARANRRVHFEVIVK